MDDRTPTGIDLHARYNPVAVYYQDADTVEYIRQDVASVNRHIDDFLTLVLDMNGRQPIGFRLKGFKNFYVHHFKSAKGNDDRDQFLALVGLIEVAAKLTGNQPIKDARRTGYDQACQIANEDNAQLRELPDVVGR